MPCATGRVPPLAVVCLRERVRSSSGSIRPWKPSTGPGPAGGPGGRLQKLVAGVGRYKLDAKYISPHAWCRMKTAVHPSAREFAALRMGALLISTKPAPWEDKVSGARTPLLPPHRLGVLGFVPSRPATGVNAAQVHSCGPTCCSNLPLQVSASHDFPVQLMGGLAWVGKHCVGQGVGGSAPVNRGAHSTPPSA